MQINVKQSELARALGVVNKAVSTKTSLPVLNNIAMIVQPDPERPGGNRLELRATNLETSFKVWVRCVPADSDGQALMEMDAGGEGLTVPARLLVEFINSLGTAQGGGKDGQVTLGINQEEWSLKIFNRKNVANLKGIDLEDFPAWPNIHNAAHTAKILVKDLRRAIQATGYCASKDESRPVLTGILTKFTGDKMIMAAADSLRLAQTTVPIVSGSNFSSLIPARSLAELFHVLTYAQSGVGDDQEVEVAMSNNKSQMLFSVPQLQFVSSTLEGTFPNYEAIIPKSYGTRLVLDTQAFLQSAKTALLFAKDSGGGNIVRLRIERGVDGGVDKLHLTATASEVGDNHSEIEGRLDGMAGSISFNGQFLRDSLEQIVTGQVALEMHSPSNPGVIKPVTGDGTGEEGHVAVIMPMHLASEAPAAPAPTPAPAPVEAPVEAEAEAEAEPAVV
jgi:DNA polymerase-3 subunit beta